MNPIDGARALMAAIFPGPASLPTQSVRLRITTDHIIVSNRVHASGDFASAPLDVALGLVVEGAAELIDPTTEVLSLLADRLAAAPVPPDPATLSSRIKPNRGGANSPHRNDPPQDSTKNI